MKKRLNIDKEIDLTMNSLDGLEKAEPSVYFYTRLKAKMESRLENPYRFYLFSPRLAAACLLFCVLSASMMIYAWRSDSQDYDMAVQQRQIEAFAKDYGYAAATFYDVK